MARDARALLTALYIAAAVTAGITVWRLLDSPFRYDEVDFAAQAGGIIEHGVPKVTRFGEVHYGMWHPPLYLYSLAASRYALGPSNWGARSAGVIWFAGIAVLIWRRAGPVPVCLALLSPLVAQGIFFLDIDNTSLAFALVLFGFIFSENPRSSALRTTVVLAGILLLAFWSKLTTPFVLLVAAFVFHALNRDWGGLRRIAMVGIIATATFFATYFLYCLITGYPADFMFATTYLGKRDMYMSAAGRSPTQALHAVWWNVIWFSPALSLLFALLAVDRVRAYWKERHVEAVDFWVLFALSVFGAYAVWAGVMGKYTFPAAVAASIALGLWLPQQLRTVRFTKPSLLGIAAALLLVWHIALIPPLQVKEPAAAAGPAMVATALRNPRNIALLVTIAGFALFAAITTRALSGSQGARLATALLVCATVANSVEAVKLMLSPDDRSPYRPFRERGFESAVQTLNRTLLPTDTIIAPKDVGFYFNGRAYRLDAIRALSGPEGVTATIRDAHIRHATDSTANPVQDSDRLLREAGLEPVEHIGDFVVYGLPK